MFILHSQRFQRKQRKKKHGPFSARTNWSHSPIIPIEMLIAATRISFHSGFSSSYCLARVAKGEQKMSLSITTHRLPTVTPGYQTQRWILFGFEPSQLLWVQLLCASNKEIRSFKPRVFRGKRSSFFRWKNLWKSWLVDGNPRSFHEYPLKKWWDCVE